MLGQLEKWGPMTVLVFVAVVIVLVVGGVVVVVHPESLTFEAYLSLLWKAAAAAGVMGVARGVNLAGEKLADAHAFVTDMSSDFEAPLVETDITDAKGKVVGQAVRRATHTKLKG